MDDDGESSFSGAAQNGLTKPTKALQPPIKSTGKSAERGALQSSPGNATERNALKPPKHPGKPTERSAHELSKLPSTKPPEISTGRKALQPSHGKPTTGRTPKASKPLPRVKPPQEPPENLHMNNPSTLPPQADTRSPQIPLKSGTSSSGDGQNGADPDKYRSREVLNDLFHSERGAKRRIKAIAGFIVGILIGVPLFLGLYYGLEYGIVAAVLITVVSTVFMSLSLAFTVRARCVALLMLPTLGTQRGRAAFLTIVVALLLNGPVNNIFLNANEVSNSMSCGAELAYNQTLMIQDTATAVTDRYVMNLRESVDDLQNIISVIAVVLDPLQTGLDVARNGLNVYENFAQAITDVCGSSATIANAESECNDATTDEIRTVKRECQDLFELDIPGIPSPNNPVPGIPSPNNPVPGIPSPNNPVPDNPRIPSIPGIGKRSIDDILRIPSIIPNQRIDDVISTIPAGVIGPGVPPRRGIHKRNVDAACDVFDGLTEATKPICEGYGEATETYCDASREVLDGLNAIQDELQHISEQLTISIDFSSYFEYRNNQSRNFTEIQQAVSDEINGAIVAINYVFSILDKILLALSMMFLLYRSYRYHTNFRTKDKFDNIYITQRFKDLDAARKKQSKTTLLPLKKTERAHLVDITSLRLSKPEKGLFKIGLTTLGVHVLIAGLIILIDNCFFWLLEIIRKHGGVTVESSGGSGAELRVAGDNFLVDFVQGLFGGALDVELNSTFDTTQCLPNGSPPDNYQTIAIAACYLVALVTVLTQAYALRLRRTIAEYFYPERESERLYYLYNKTLKRRKTLFKFLKELIKGKQKEQEAKQKVSLRVYLADRYLCIKKVFKLLHISTEIKYNACLGCDSQNDGTFQQCQRMKCPGMYCDECLKETNNNCAICDEPSEDNDNTHDNEVIVNEATHTF